MTDTDRAALYQALMEKRPEHRMPIDGAGDEYSYNNGFNDGISAVYKAIDEVFNSK